MSFKLVKIGDSYRVTYVSKGFATGLTNVTGSVISPTGATTAISWSGSNPALGFCELAQGLYYYDWNSTGKASGIWSFKADSATKSNPGADSIFLVDGDTLDNTPFEKIDTMLDSVLSAINNATYGLSALHGDLVSVAGDVTTVKGDVESATFGLGAIKGVVDAIQGAVGQISNSTKNNWVAPASVLISPTANTTRRVYMNIFDNVGNMEDPDLQEIQVEVFSPTGSDVTSSYVYGAAPIYMTRSATGQYYIDFTVASGSAETDLRFKNTYVEGGLTVVRDGIITLATTDGSLSAQLTSIDGKLNEIKGAGFDTMVDSLHDISVVVSPGGYII